MNLPNLDLNSLYQAALTLTDAERLTLARRMLESIEYKKTNFTGNRFEAINGTWKRVMGYSR